MAPSDFMSDPWRERERYEFEREWRRREERLRRELYEEQARLLQQTPKVVMAPPQPMAAFEPPPLVSRDPIPTKPTKRKVLLCS